MFSTEDAQVLPLTVYYEQERLGRKPPANSDDLPPSLEITAIYFLSHQYKPLLF